MKIECILKRQGGTRAEIGGIEYHFAPQADGAHVADVKDKAHIARFLSMPEGYAVYDPDGAASEPEPDGAALDGDTNGDGQIDEAEERAQLVAAYEAKFGKKPSARMGLDTLRQKLAE